MAGGFGGLGVSFIRPEITALASRASEVIAAAAMLGFGLWLIWLGGLLLIPIGLIVCGLSLGWGILALRRMRFAQGVTAPGVVEVDEGQVGYLGPQVGGFASLDELQEIRLMTLQGRRMWRLKQRDGQTILIPVDAEGAERLFDAFSSLPGLDSAALVAALQPQITQNSGETLPRGPVAAEMRLIWHRKGAGVVSSG